jgi:hypothetical protein
MRRDLDLFRKILICLEDPKNELSGVAEEEALQYHLRLMVEAGLLHGHISEHSDGYAVLLNENRTITNAGHDLLDHIRTDTMWNKIKSRFSGFAGGISIELLKEVAKQEGRKFLGLDPG